MGFLAAGIGRPIALKEGETRELNVALTRTYAIDVRVLDEWGDPLSRVTVNAQSAESGRSTSSLSNHSTDDLGRQRVFGLQPGRYIVCAESSIAGVSVGGRGDALLRTCHPSAIDEAEAQVVRVDRSDVGEVEIRMRRGRTFTIAGRIVDVSGAPAPGARLSLSQHRSGRSGGMSQTIDTEGRFRITNVHPGAYAIEASIGGPNQPEQRRPLERAFLPIQVDTTDISDLSVTLEKTVSVVGRVTLEDPTAPFIRPPNYGPLSVWSWLADDKGPGSGSRALCTGERRPIVHDDERLRPSHAGPREPAARLVHVRSIRYDGREIIDEPSTFKDSGGEPTVEVLLSNRGAVVVGRATDETGNAVGRAMVVMFPADARMSWRQPAETRASPAGQFRTGPVRAGEYYIVALPDSTGPIRPDDPARLARLAAAADRITLGEFEERTVDLRIVAVR